MASLAMATDRRKKQKLKKRTRLKLNLSQKNNLSRINIRNYRSEKEDLKQAGQLAIFDNPVRRFQNIRSYLIWLYLLDPEP